MRSEDFMDEDDPRDVDFRTSSKSASKPPKDLRGKIASTVMKIKTEKVKMIEDVRMPMMKHVSVRRRDDEHEARPRQRSERRPDRSDHDDRRKRREQERRGTTERTDRNKDRDLRSTDDRRNSLKSSSKFRESSRKHDTESRSKRRSPRPMRIKKVKYFDIY